MGIYNTYGEKGIQLKVGDCCLHHYSVGDKCDIDDGIYAGHEGIIVIKDGIFITEYSPNNLNFDLVKMMLPNSTIYDKWGGIISSLEDVEENNPIKQALKDLGYE